jgi:hypothetical protein
MFNNDKWIKKRDRLKISYFCFYIFFKIYYSQLPRGLKIKKKLKNIHVSHMELTCGDSIQSASMVCNRGVKRGIWRLDGGIYEKFFYKRVSQNSLTLQGSISLLILLFLQNEITSIYKLIIVESQIQQKMLTSLCYLTTQITLRNNFANLAHKVAWFFAIN